MKAACHSEDIALSTLPVVTRNTAKLNVRKMEERAIGHLTDMKLNAGLPASALSFTHAQRTLRGLKNEETGASSPNNYDFLGAYSQPAFSCSNSTMEIP